ncbi:MAG: pilus assembly protein TadD [Caulobacteraceae bacterium]
MCRMTALAATVLCLAAFPVLAAEPAAAPATPQAPTTEAAPPTPQKAGPQQRAEADRMDALARAAFWANESDIDPRDVEASLKLSRALRELGRWDDAANSAQRILVYQPENVEALLEIAKARIGQNQGFYAIEPAQRAAELNSRDWRPVALLAIAFEQAERDDEALAAHQRALGLAPNNPTVLANLGLFYATHGDPAQGEALLRRAVSLPGSTAQMRQSLALVIGLQGRVDEAERLARQDLPPNVVANNMAYLRAAAQPVAARSWDSVRQPQ